MNRRPRPTVRAEIVKTAAALIFLLLAFGFAGGCDKADAAALRWGVMENGESATMTNPATWDAIDASGAGVVRIMVGPGYADRQEAEIAQAESRGLEVLPCFALGRGADASDPGTLAAWGAWAQAFAARHQNIHAWETWNEPNVSAMESYIADPATAANLIATLGAAVRSAIPTAEIIAPGLYTGEAPRWYMQGIDRHLRQIGAPHAYTAMSVHPYVLLVPGLGVPTNQSDAEAIAAETVRLIHSVGRLHPTMPVYVSEIGWAAVDYGAPDDPTIAGPAEQARLIRTVLGALADEREALNLKSVIYYAIADNRASGWPGGAGLISPEGPRPAYYAFRSVTKITQKTP